MERRNLNMDGDTEKDGEFKNRDGKKDGGTRNDDGLVTRQSFISICDENGEGDGTGNSVYRNRRTLLSQAQIKEMSNTNQRSRNSLCSSGSDCSSHSSSSNGRNRCGFSGSNGDSQTPRVMQVVFNVDDDERGDGDDSDNEIVYSSGRGDLEERKRNINLDERDCLDRIIDREVVMRSENGKNGYHGYEEEDPAMRRNFRFSQFDSQDEGDDVEEGLSNGDGVVGDDSVDVTDDVKNDARLKSKSMSFCENGNEMDAPFSHLAYQDLMQSSLMKLKHESVVDVKGDDDNDEDDISADSSSSCHDSLNFSSDCRNKDFSQTSSVFSQLSYPAGVVPGSSTLLPTASPFDIDQSILAAATETKTVASISSSSAAMSAEERLYNKTMELFPHLQAIMNGFQSGALNNDTHNDGSHNNNNDNSLSSRNWNQKMSPIFPDLMTLMKGHETDSLPRVATSANTTSSTSSQFGSGEDISITTTTESFSNSKTSTPEMDKEHEEFLRRLTSSDFNDSSSSSMAEATVAPPKIVDIFKPEKVKRHKCEICGKAFGRSSDLRRHIRIHTGEKNHICPVCTKAFNQSGDLQRHIKTHSGEKPHVCAICGKGFTQKGDVKIHMRIHTGERPHLCVICNKSFNQSSYLTTHMKSHTGERNHICGVCDKAFVENSDLKKHMRTHTGERPHECTICHKAFNRNNNLIRHIVNIHGRQKSSI